MILKHRSMTAAAVHLGADVFERAAFFVTAHAALCRLRQSKPHRLARRLLVQQDDRLLGNRCRQAAATFAALRAIRMLVADFRPRRNRLMTEWRICNRANFGKFSALRMNIRQTVRAHTMRRAR